MPDADYKLITERILHIKGKHKIVLFGASDVRCLPITIPVNAAISLAGSGKKCLLIDMDIKRNAIAKAFELDEKAGNQFARPRAYKTHFDNLRIWPGHNFMHSYKVDFRSLVDAAKGEFDFVLVSDPYLGSNGQQLQITLASECGFIFTQNTMEATRLASIMNASKCSLIGNINVAPS